MKEIELTEMTLPEKKTSYDAMVNVYPKEIVDKLREMVFTVGAEQAIAYLMKSAIDSGVSMPDELYNLAYNACLYMQEQSHS